MRKHKIIRLVEFFIVGLTFGIIEDLIAIYFSTDAQITWNTVLIAFLVAFPFAVFSELVVDHPGFWKKILPHSLKDKLSKEKQEHFEFNK